MRKLITLFFAAALLTACHKDDNPEVPNPVRTVIVYMSAENSLSSCSLIDFNEMIEGSKLMDEQDNLIVWFDRAKSDELPWLCRINKGLVTDSVSIDDMGISAKDERSSDPKIFEQVLRYAYSHYPATDGYGLVLWGHAAGWTMQDSLAYSRGYGIDNGYNYSNSDYGYWLNIPTIRKVLEQMPKQLFILADCCNFMCLESIYELRNVTDYIIGSPAEIPDPGAPYNTVVPAMFKHDSSTSSSSDAFVSSIIENYSEAYPNYLPLSAVNTSEIEAVAIATRDVLKIIAALPEGYAVKDSTIHYYYDGSNYYEFNPSYNIFYDAGDYVRSKVSDADYRQWRKALDKAVVVKHISKSWETNKSWYRYYRDFNVTEEKFHGVSMFVPQEPASSYYIKYKEDIKKFQWYYKTYAYVNP